MGGPPSGGFQPEVAAGPTAPSPPTGWPSQTSEQAGGPGQGSRHPGHLAGKRRGLARPAPPTPSLPQQVWGPRARASKLTAQRRAGL